MLPSADEALTGCAGECAVLGEGTYDLQVFGTAHRASDLMTTTVALTPVVSEIERLRTRSRVVVMGMEIDGVASALKLFHVVPN